MMRPHLGAFLGKADPAKLAARPMHGLPESDFVEAATIGTAMRALDGDRLAQRESPAAVVFGELAPYHGIVIDDVDRNVCPAGQTGGGEAAAPRPRPVRPPA